MNAYVDASVVLRIVLGEPDPVQSWSALDVAVSSELVRLECLRTVDRARLRGDLGDEVVAGQRAAILDIIDRFDLVPVTTSVLERASQPFPTSIGSMDAIHLASALAIDDVYDDLVFLTHDRGLALAARSMGFQVDGA
ncbi:MAG: type II toxin-antitoxin system VapC family toxin [Candidatus Limnocylindrales bacterium]